MKNRNNTLNTTVQYVDPEQEAFKQMHQQTLIWLANWLPHVPQELNYWRNAGSFNIEPPTSELEPGFPRDCERIHWVAYTVSQLIREGGRIASINYWASDTRSPMLMIKMAVGTVHMNYRAVDIFTVDLNHTFLVRDLIDMIEGGDDMAFDLQEHIMEAADRLKYDWESICALARDFVSDNAE